MFISSVLLHHLYSIDKHIMTTKIHYLLKLPICRYVKIKMMKTFFYRLFQLTWGLPQTLVGFVLFLKYRKSPHYTYKGAVVTNWPRNGGISLGMFTFIEKHKGRQEYIQKHEYGHTLQSLILGPLYLFVVGIPSFTWANLPYFAKKRATKNIPYNSFIVEKTADMLGGNKI